MSGLDPADAVHTTLTTTGRGIVFNALSVIVGFVVLLYSAFMPVKFFGFLVVLSIFSCLAGALLLIPALCLVFRPRFLEPGGR
jgi:predicted RND superfamily exporter protein